MHIVCAHTIGLLRLHGSLWGFANQGCEAAHKLIRQLLNFTSRGGGRHFKDVALAVLERHYRIHMLHHLHSTQTDWSATMLVDGDGNEVEGTANIVSMEMEDMKAVVGELDMEWTRDKRVRKREDVVSASAGASSGLCIVAKRVKRKQVVKGE